MRRPTFIPDEYHKKLRVEAATNGVSIYKQHTRILMQYYDSDYEVPTIQEGDPTPVKVKKERRDHTDDDAFIAYFTEQFLKRIGRIPPFMNKATVYRNISGPMAHYGLEKLKSLLDKYFDSNDKWHKTQRWNILTFLSMRTLNTIEQ